MNKEYEDRLKLLIYNKVNESLGYGQVVGYPILADDLYCYDLKLTYNINGQTQNTILAYANDLDISISGKTPHAYWKEQNQQYPIVFFKPQENLSSTFQYIKFGTDWAHFIIGTGYTDDEVETLIDTKNWSVSGLAYSNFSFEPLFNGATWSMDGMTYECLEKVGSRAGTKTVTFGDFASYVTPEPLQVRITRNALTKATGIYYKEYYTTKVRLTTNSYMGEKDWTGIYDRESTATLTLEDMVYKMTKNGLTFYIYRIMEESAAGPTWIVTPKAKGEPLTADDIIVYSYVGNDRPSWGIEPQSFTIIGGGWLGRDYTHYQVNEVS